MPLLHSDRNELAYEVTIYDVLPQFVKGEVPLEKELIMPSASPLLTRCPSRERDTWTTVDARAIYELPFNDLLFRAHSVHRENFNPNQVQLSKLLSIKTGGCPEDCGYCSQSARSATGLNASKLMDVDQVIDEARKAKDGGATRYCMGRPGAVRSRATWMLSLQW
jgi:biotin synthase